MSSEFDPANARAIKQLGLAHYHLGEMAQAFRYLLKTQELTPDDLDVRLKLGANLLPRRQARGGPRRGACLSSGSNPRTSTRSRCWPDTASHA